MNFSIDSVVTYRIRLDLPTRLPFNFPDSINPMSVNRDTPNFSAASFVDIKYAIIFVPFI